LASAALISAALASAFFRELDLEFLELDLGLDRLDELEEN
jgi:hypothetical protein